MANRDGVRYNNDRSARFRSLGRLVAPANGPRRGSVRERTIASSAAGYARRGIRLLRVPRRTPAGNARPGSSGSEFSSDRPCFLRFFARLEADGATLGRGRLRFIGAQSLQFGHQYAGHRREPHPQLNGPRCVTAGAIRKTGRAAAPRSSSPRRRGGGTLPHRGLGPQRFGRSRLPKAWPPTDNGLHAVAMPPPHT